VCVCVCFFFLVLIFVWKITFEYLQLIMWNSLVLGSR